jgi:hypothetical protein
MPSSTARSVSRISPTMVTNCNRSMALIGTSLESAQIRAARALLGWRQEDLSKASGGGTATRRMSAVFAACGALSRVCYQL